MHENIGIYDISKYQNLYIDSKIYMISPAGNDMGSWDFHSPNLSYDHKERYA